MPTDISANLDRYEADDLRQFSFVNTLSVPSTVAFVVKHTDGTTLAPVAVQSGVTVTISGASNVGLFYALRQLPSSVGMYTAEWYAYGSGTAQQSLFTVTRFTFEIYRTEAHSFYTYGNRAEVVRRARILFSRSDLTERDMRPYMEAADGWINGKLGMVMTVPFSPIPNLVREISNAGALYYMYSTRYAIEREEAPPGIVDQWDRYDEYLDAVAAGSATIEVQSGTLVRRDEEVSMFTGAVEGGAAPTFGMRDWEKQKVDDAVTDAEDDLD